MTISLLRQGKLPAIVTRTNECQNPSFELSSQNWVNWSWGSGGNGTMDNPQGLSWPPFGAGILHKKWSTAPTSNAGAGFRYLSLPWSPGVTKTLSGYMLVPQVAVRHQIHVDFLDAFGHAVGTADTVSSDFPATTNQTLRVWLTATAPDSTDHAVITFSLATGGTLMPVNGDLYLDGVLFESTAQLLPYFDGSIGAGKTYGDAVSWAGATHGDISYYSQPDPNTVITPDMVVGYDDEQGGTTNVHTLLSGLVTATWHAAGPGEIASGSTRAGTLRLLFGGTDGGARSAAARKGLIGNYPWHYADTDSPEAEMNFAVSGPVRRYQSDSRATWLLDVPFTELSAAVWKAPVG